ncbi:MAG TPA: ABC transporter permease, partial [Egibacteraceae bacterium]
MTQPAPEPAGGTTAEALPPPAEAREELSRRRGLTGLGRLQVTGIVFGLIGLATVLWVASALPGEDVTLTFGLGDVAPSLRLDPPNAVRAIGVLLVLAGGVAVAERWTRRWAALALLVATILVVPYVLIAGVALSGQSQTNLVPLFAEALRRGTPIALGALAGLWCERSGVVNIGIEGMMLAGAGVGFVAYALWGAGGGLALVAAVLVAVAVGGLLSVIHAVVSISFRTDQIVSGVAINLLAIGLTAFLRRQVLLPLGIGSAVTLPQISLPVLSDLPLIGPLFVGKPIYFSMFVLFLLTSFVMFRTPWGLRVRAVGEQPHAAETLGVDVIRIRYQAVILGGLAAGLGGAWFSLETVGSFDDLMTNGTGFIALAAL